MTAGVVYVLGAPGSNTVKIGRTINLAKRVADIQRMSPVPLTVLWTHPGGSELEARLHRHFGPLRSHGEWFRFETEPVEAIKAAVESLAIPYVEDKSAPVRLTKEAQENWHRVLDEASADHAARRAELEVLIADCRKAGLPLSLISERTPFSREWVRRIADRVERERAA